MVEEFRPENIPLTAISSLNLSRFLLSIKESDFLVTLSDGPLIIKAKWLMINIFMWRPLVRRNLPVLRRHTLHDGLFTMKVLANIKTNIYEDVVGGYLRNGGLIPEDIDRDILSDLCESVNDLHTMIATQLGEYHLSISAFELADLLLHPEVEPLMSVDVSREQMIGITATEEKISAAGKMMVAKLRDKSLPSNVIAPFLELGLLNELQLAQVMVAIGYRTDASDSMVRKPILDSYIRGISSNIDFAIESLMAKKAVYYNKNAMPKSSYDNRKQQLLSCVIRHLYPGDCGTTLTTPFFIKDQKVANNLINKNIVEDGIVYFLNKENLYNYIGKTVQLRSPLTCRHTDGVCRICGGRMTDFIPPQTIIGIACTIEYMANVSQRVLSLKHQASTKAIAYVVPEHLREILFVRQNDIYIKEKIDADRLKIGIQFQDIPYIMELKNKTTDEDGVMISEQQFSTINYLIFADADTDVPLTPEIRMMSGGNVPYLSSEMIVFIKDNFKNVVVSEDMVWISLRKFDHVNEPLLRCVVQSDSMIRFSATLGDFFMRQIKGYSSVSDALRDFAEKVFEQIDTNIFNLEVVLKSYLVTNEINYNVPVVTDPNNVQFGTLSTIIPRRSIGGMLSYQQLADYMAKEPELYNLPHRKGIFDVFFTEE